MTPLAGEALGGAGALFVVGAAVWGLGVRRSARRRLLGALHDPDPNVRAAAVEVASTNGIGRYAAVLHSMALNDPSAFVRRRVGEVVVRNQWEPASSRALVELRLLARQEWDREVQNGCAGGRAVPGRGRSTDEGGRGA